MLFNDLHDPTQNHLPYNGCVHYWGVITSPKKAHQYYTELLENIAWKNDEAIIFGKHIITKRKVAWYADHTFEYTYSKISRTALVWTPLLLRLKALVESKTGQQYNSCLLNLYHNGQEGMAWHSDDEKDLQPHGSIASLSFGATRKFVFKHKRNKTVVNFLLNSGDLLEMKNETQHHWLHRLPPTTKVFEPRINLTFRQMMR